MKISNAEQVLRAAQVILIGGVVWQLGATTSWENGALVTALLVPVLVLGAFRSMIRKNQLKNELEMLRELEESERSAHELASRLDAVTRREIAGWIHGDLQRELIRVGRSLRAHGHIEASNELAKINDDVVRAMSHKLYPHQLEVSIHLALTDLCHERAALTMSDNLSLTMFKGLQSRVMPFELRLATYRIVEEGLNNAEKKPSTTAISVSVEAIDDLLRISVIDNGEPLSDVPNNSLGFTLINTYVRQFNGTWKISNTASGVLLAASLSFASTETVAERAAPLLQTKK